MVSHQSNQSSKLCPSPGQKMAVAFLLLFAACCLLLFVLTVADSQSRYTQVTPRASENEKVSEIIPSPVREIDDLNDKLDDLVKEINDTKNLRGELQEPQVDFQLNF